MNAKNDPTNVNTNNNTNNVKVNVNVEHPKKPKAEKKSTPNWYTKTIIGGIIALILSICAYYIKGNIDQGGGSKNGTEIIDRNNKIEPER